MAAILNYTFLAFSAGEMGGPLDVNPGLIIWTVVTFIVLLLILKKFAWKPILGSLSEREKHIEDSLEKAEKAQAEAHKLYEENKANLAKAEEESQRILEQGKEYAEQVKTQMLEEARKETEKIKTNAQAEIERKTEEAFSRLKGEVAGIAIGAAEKILRETLDKEKQSALVDKYIQDISKN